MLVAAHDLVVEGLFGGHREGPIRAGAVLRSQKERAGQGLPAGGQPPVRVPATSPVVVRTGYDGTRLTGVRECPAHTRRRAVAAAN